eukprot:2273234-Pyramimonas_sp.AAC.1
MGHVEAAAPASRAATLEEAFNGLLTLKNASRSRRACVPSSATPPGPIHSSWGSSSGLPVSGSLPTSKKKRRNTKRSERKKRADIYQNLICDQAQSFMSAIGYMTVGTTDNTFIDDILFILKDYVELVERNSP